MTRLPLGFLPLLAQLSQGTAELDWIAVLLLMLIPGAFGGILSVLQLLEIPRLIAGKNAIGNWSRFCGAAVLGAFGGCGGALGMLLAGVWTSQLDFNATTHNRLLFISLGMVSGFLGFKLLKTVATNLETQIRDVELRTKDQIEGIKDQLIEDNNTLDIASSIRDDPNASTEKIEEIIPELAQVATRRRGDRTVAILLGNLYDRIGKHQEAVSVVTDALTERERMGTSKDKDAADLLFNRACYRIPLLKQETDDDRKKRLHTAIIQDLIRSFDLSPANRIEAKSDEDLAFLSEDEEFKKIVGGA
jgi:hypothetical protein